MGRDIIMELPSEERLRMQSTQPFGLYSDGEMQTSWGGFSLSESMRSVVAFSATRTSSWSDFGRISFPSVILNYGGGFSSVTNSFRAPVTGIYYFSFSAGAAPFAGLRAVITTTSGGQCEIWREGTSHNGYDTLSRTTMLRLNAGEEAWVELRGGLLFSDDVGRQISFSGFLYQPVSTPVAWSVHRTTSWASSGGSRLSPVEFQEPLVNVGGAWNQTSYQITIPKAGIYYFQTDVGAVNGRQVNFNMIYNDVRSAADVFRGSIMHNGQDSLGRGIIADMNAGDVIYISASPGTAVYSDSDRQTSFSGFLIYER